MQRRKMVENKSMMRRVEKITGREEFESLAPQWNALLERSAANTIALTHEWLTTWWDVFGENRELFILLVREGKNLIGIAPLLKRRVSSFGLGVTRLEFLASGEDEADEICSDYLDFICERGRENDAIESIFRYLDEAKNEWDELLLKEIIGTSPSIELMRAHGEKAGMKCEVSSIGEAVYIPLEEGWEHLEKNIPRRMRHQLRQDERKAQANDYIIEITEHKANFEEAFAHFVRLHQNLWQERGFPGVFASDIFTQFHKKLADKLLPQGRLRLYILYSGTQALAALYIFVYAHKAYYYQSGFNYKSTFQSPGTLLQAKAIRHSIETGLREWDFLKAQPGDYKYRWSKQAHPLVEIRIAKPQAKETVRASATFVVNKLRKVKRALNR